MHLRLVFSMVYGFNSKFHVEALLFLYEELHIFSQKHKGLHVFTQTTNIIGAKLKYARCLSADTICSHKPKFFPSGESSKGTMVKFEGYKNRKYTTFAANGCSLKFLGNRRLLI